MVVSASKVNDGLQTDAAHGLDAAGSGDPIHQRAEDQRSDDGLDQPQKYVGHGGHPLRFGDIGKGNPYAHSHGHADENPAGERKLPDHRSPHFNFSRSTSKNNILGGRTR
jgi:hypothetical protein